MGDSASSEEDLRAGSDYPCCGDVRISCVVGNCVCDCANAKAREPLNARPRRRFWIEAGLGAFSGVLCVLTLLVPDWIEAVFRVNPDRHSGAIEWAIAAGLLVAAVGVGLQARREWRSFAVGFKAAR